VTPPLPAVFLTVICEYRSPTLYIHTENRRSADTFEGNCTFTKVSKSIALVSFRQECRRVSKDVVHPQVLLTNSLYMLVS
jgi:hypothetical protein